MASYNIGKITVTLEPNEHQHTWQLAKFVEGKSIYRTMAVGMSTLDYKVGKKPDKSLYVCDCGEKKEVAHEEDA